MQRSETQLTIMRPETFDDIVLGSSIAVSGVCLTVVALDDNSMIFDVVAETWDKTSLGALEQGSQVNLERALKADGRFDGHIVQGHIEGVATVKEVGSTFVIELPGDLTELVVRKGSITIDGVSLTVASNEQNMCVVALIPHTLAETTLGKRQPGDKVNIETDILGRYVRHLHSV